MTHLEERARLKVPKERGGAMVIRQGLLSLALVVIIVASSASTGRAQPGLDPQVLIGEWRGKWTSGAVTGGPGPRSGREGPFALTITRVQGNVVHGTIEMQGVTTKIRATLQGNQLRFGNEQIQTELTIDGDHMRGTRQRAGTPQVLLDLEKGK
jgi:Biogenesis factor required for ATP synthase 1, C-terminal domain